MPPGILRNLGVKLKSLSNLLTKGLTRSLKNDTPRAFQPSQTAQKHIIIENINSCQDVQYKYKDLPSTQFPWVDPQR